MTKNALQRSLPAAYAVLVAVQPCLSLATDINALARGEGPTKKNDGAREIALSREQWQRSMRMLGMYSGIKLRDGKEKAEEAANSFTRLHPEESRNGNVLKDLFAANGDSRPQIRTILERDYGVPTTAGELFGGQCGKLYLGARGQNSGLYPIAGMVYSLNTHSMTAEREENAPQAFATLFSALEIYCPNVAVQKGVKAFLQELSDAVEVGFAAGQAGKSFESEFGSASDQAATMVDPVSKFHSEDGTEVLLSPSVKPSGRVYTVQGVLTKFVEGTFIFETSSALDARKIYFKMRQTAATEGDLESLKIGGTYTAIGKYVDNDEVLLTDGSSVTSPVFDALHIGQ